jgi:hypothetical protein
MQDALGKAEALTRDDQLDQGDGSQQSSSCERSVFEASFSSWICGEVKRTIQKYRWQVLPKRARGQTWKTFLRHHAAEVSGVGGL